MAEADSGFFAQTAYDAQQPQELKLLSASSYAMIWRGNRDGRFRIFKCLSPEHRGDPLYERMLRKEFEIGYNLQHPNVCNFYSFTALPDLGNCIEMEWIDGCTLADLAADGPLTDRKLCRQIISEVCDALSYMHAKHIVHRDLKPSNIMISHIGRHVSLIDFGLSDSESHSILKSPAGTQFFAAPELVAGQNPDWRSDIYSLGRTIASTMKPFGDIARKCCRSDREKRYQSAQKVKEALGRRGGWKSAGVVAVASIAIAAFVLPLQPPEAIYAAESMPPVGTALPAEASVGDSLQEQQLESPSVPVQTKVAHKAMPERTDPPAVAANSESADEAAQAIDAASIDSLFRQATELFN